MGQHQFIFEWTQALFGLLLACFTLAPMPVHAQTKPKPSEIYMYKGTDREARLIAEAKQEGTVVVYTLLNLKDSVPITEVFEKKYGVKVSLWRASSEKVVQRAVTEARAGRFLPDVFETNGPEMEILFREKLMDEFYSPEFKDIPAAAFPSTGIMWPTAGTSLSSPTTPIWLNRMRCPIPTKTCCIPVGMGRWGSRQATWIGSAPW